MEKKTMLEKANDLGISVYCLKQRIKKENEEKKLHKARWDLIRESEGKDRNCK